MPEERESTKAYHCILGAFIEALAIEITCSITRQVSQKKPSEQPMAYS